jgi:hypothetical protein
MWIASETNNSQNGELLPENAPSSPSCQGWKHRRKKQCGNTKTSHQSKEVQPHTLVPSRHSRYKTTVERYIRPLFVGFPVRIISSVVHQPIKRYMTHPHSTRSLSFRPIPSHRIGYQVSDSRKSRTQSPTTRSFPYPQIAFPCSCCLVHSSGIYFFRSFVACSLLQLARSSRTVPAVRRLLVRCAGILTSD